MKKNLSPYLILFFAIVFTASCNIPRHIYSPSALNVPVLTKKGDSKLGAAYSTSVAGQETKNGVDVDNRSRGYDLQGAVAITNNFALQAQHFYRWEKNRRRPRQC